MFKFIAKIRGKIIARRKARAWEKRFMAMDMTRLFMECFDPDRKKDEGTTYRIQRTDGSWYEITVGHPAFADIKEAV